VATGLSYCNRCGANLKPAEAPASSKRPAGLAWIVWFGILIMGSPFPAMIIVFDEVKKLYAAGFPLSYVMMLAIIGLLTVFGGVLLLSRVLSPMVKAYLQISESPAEQKKPELPERTPAQLEAAREPVSSVTENTTRTFEPLYREQKTR
jgi:hypothetical protein